MNTKRVIGVVGMPGSGKSVADQVAKEMDFSIVIMGDAIREEVARRRLDPTPENVGKIMIRIRAEEGQAVVAKRCVPRIQSTQSRNVIVEGIRNLDEVYEFRRYFSDFKLIAIHVSQETRFRRIFNRNRSDDLGDWEAFTRRDLREIEVGIGSAIALADYMVVNEGSPSRFKASFRKCLKAILSERSYRDH